MGNHLGIYITDDANKTFELPINPAEVELTAETDDKSETVTGLGEVNLIGDSKLRSISVQSTLPLDPSSEHYVSAQNLLGSAQEYIDWLLNIQESKKPMRLVISSTKISFKATISSFQYGFKNGYDGEYVYTLTLKEYRPFLAKKVTKEQSVISESTRPTPPNKVGIGSTVIVNGQLHRDSAGNGLGLIEQNATRKISLINPGSSYPYHVVTLDGGARGWVKESDVKSA
ncbi:hypothetical protein M5C72_06315 [Companilactobacillus allii]|uniref:Phage tail protein n=1 Tax=Companilactobacillus allii TaxID=1847728 RepID=A0A1P8Q4C7_9LACO|nr:hypothetical protein [Companilactobacillus allii]APX72718.1 hypothetical protein BTM29_09215 [Companilactobacillus allii]USQ67501.1 hypothetical protein M5C72_06315 [Companilactobacillus allii]